MISNYQICIQISNTLSISIACENTNCIEAIQAVYPFCDVHLTNIQDFPDISVYYGCNYYSIEYKNRKYDRLSIGEFQLIFCDFLDMCLEYKLLAQQSLFALHGSVATNGVSTLGFIAKSHTGKSTLLALLEVNGFHFISDDIIIVDAKTGKVQPYYRPIKLRSIINEQVDHYILAKGQSPLRDEFLYIIPSTATIRKDSYKLSAILYVQRTPTPEVKITSLPDRDAYIYLLKNSKISDKSTLTRYLNEALAFRKTIRSFQFMYDEASDAVKILEGIWGHI